jgi:hypothetical protein
MREASTSRRDFIVNVAASAALASTTFLPPFLHASDDPKGDARDAVSQITDPEIRAGMTAAIERNLIPAASEKLYPGHFTISADGSAYGPDSTWPGLDSWQMAGAYLMLGRTRLVLDYFDFVRASQRKDGNIPWAIFPGTTRPDTTWLSGLTYPEGSFFYDPPKREGVPPSALEKKEWVGMFGHWQPKARPLSNLGAVCYILTASEIFDHHKSESWLHERIASIESAAKYLLSRKTDNGLIAGSGFYTELPPRYGWDGVGQCYVVHAFRQIARLLTLSGNKDGSAAWTKHADALASAFIETFWRGDHFAEYVHIDRGLVDSHGLSDTNLAAIAFNVASDAKAKTLWPLITNEPAMWAGNVPTQTVAKPQTYQPWELHEKLSFGAPPLKDAAAMGRVWFLDAKASRRMNDHGRLRESVRNVCRAAKDGYWPERFHAPPKPGPAVRVGPERYCEYPAVLVRTVLENLDLFRG